MSDYLPDQLVKAGNTVVVIEHNLDVIKNADWAIDLGLKGGDHRSEIVAEGSWEVSEMAELSFVLAQRAASEEWRGKNAHIGPVLPERAP